MSAHTPGPWQVSGVRVRLDRQPMLQVGPDSYTIAFVCYSDRRPGDHVQSHADARLIAAAPDMLAALKRVLAVADRKTDEFDAARAAIAKAEGSQPPYGEWCRKPDACAGKGYCPLDPTCGD